MPFRSLFALYLLTDGRIEGVSQSSGIFPSPFRGIATGLRVSCADDGPDARVSGHKRKRSANTTGNSPSRHYIPELSNCIVAHESLDEVLHNYHSEFHDTEIDLVMVRFVDSAQPDGGRSPNISQAPPRVRNMATPLGAPNPPTTLRVTEHAVHIDLPRVFRATQRPAHTSPIDAGQQSLPAMRFYITSTNEQKILHAIAVATQRLKAYFLQNGLIPRDDIEATPVESRLVRKCRLFFFELDEASSLFHWYDVQEVQAGDTRPVLVARDISSTFSKDVDAAYVMRCIGEHILFTFKSTILERSMSNVRTSERRERHNAEMFHGTPFYAFLSANAVSRESLLVGVTAAIDVMKEKLQHEISGENVEKLHAWVPPEGSRLGIEVEYERVVMLNDSTRGNIAWWAKSDGKGGGRKYIASTDSWAYEFAPLAINRVSPYDAPETRFAHTIYPLSNAEHRVLSRFADAFRGFFLSLESAPAESTTWVFKLPQLSDASFPPECAQRSGDVRWSVILRYLPMALSRTAALLRQELQADGRFGTFEASWPTLVTLVPPAYVPDRDTPGMSHYTSLRIGLDYLRDIQRL